MVNAMKEGLVCKLIKLGQPINSEAWQRTQLCGVRPGVPIVELQMSEAALALLFALIDAYAPFRHPARFTMRRELVMVPSSTAQAYTNRR